MAMARDRSPDGQGRNTMLSLQNRLRGHKNYSHVTRKEQDIVLVHEFFTNHVGLNSVYMTLNLMLT